MRKRHAGQALVAGPHEGRETSRIIMKIRSPNDVRPRSARNLKDFLLIDLTVLDTPNEIGDKIRKGPDPL